MQNIIKAGRRRPPTRKELVQALKNLAVRIGRCPTYVDLMVASKQRRSPSYNRYRVRFGSFNGALRAAGFAVNREVR